MNTTVSVIIPDELVSELDSIARITERSISFHVQKALEIYIREMADIQIDLDRLKDASDHVVSLNEMAETAYLMKSPKNAKRLSESTEDLKYHY